MKLLLDTHAFLWFAADDPRLSATARDSIENEANEVYLSAASHWEIAIKQSVGKLSLDRPFRTLISEEVELNGIIFLPIDLSHSEAVLSLAFHHRDPFDRMLIAQSMVEEFPLLSCDEQFDAYGIARIW